MKEGPSVDVLDLPGDRFTVESGFLVRLELPEQVRSQVMDAVLSVTDLNYGDYDTVSFTSSPGITRFRSLGGGHNPAKDSVSGWQCVEVTFFLPDDLNIVESVLRQIYASHPAEEPVIHLMQASRTLHIRGLDEDNPNRFWNGAGSESYETLEPLCEPQSSVACITVAVFLSVIALQLSVALG
jgi:hypothetical protein